MQLTPMVAVNATDDTAATAAQQTQTGTTVRYCYRSAADHLAEAYGVTIGYDGPRLLVQVTTDLGGEAGWMWDIRHCQTVA